MSELNMELPPIPRDLVRTSIHQANDLPKEIGAFPPEVRLTAPID